MAKNKRLILHIGMPKTGTTSIQNTLGRHRKKILQYGIRYPNIKPLNHIFKFPVLFLEKKNDNELLLRAKSENPSLSIDEIVERYKNEWIAEFNECQEDIFIISAETLCGLNRKEILKVKDFLIPFFNNIQIVVYVRHIDNAMVSMAQQKIKNGVKGNSLKKIVENTISAGYPSVFYKSAIEGWIEIFGQNNVSIRVFDKKHWAKNSLLIDFLSTIGADTSVMDDVDEVTSNVSLGKYSIAFIEQLNKKYPRIVNGKINIDKGMADKPFPLYLYENIPDEKFELTIIYNKKQRNRLNAEIDWVNSFLEPEKKFSHIPERTGFTQYPDAKDIDINFFIELVNNYNKEIEKLMFQNDEIKNKSKKRDKNTAEPQKKSNTFDEEFYKLYAMCGNRKAIILKNLAKYIKYKFKGLKGFDEIFYQRKYPHVQQKPMDCLFHFIMRGVYLGMNPNSEFDVHSFLLDNTQIINKGGNALEEYNRRKYEEEVHRVNI